MSFIDELKRRNVIRVATAYIVVAWLSIQVIDVLAPMFDLPEWLGRAVVLMLIVAFPISLLLAWAYEITPSGIRRERDVERSRTVRQPTGRVFDFIVIGVLSAALVFFVVDKFALIDKPERPIHEDEVMDQQQFAGLRDDRRQTVAVIRFIDMSQTNDQAWIGETVATELQAELAKRSDFQVLSRSSSFALPDGLSSSQDIGRFLGVDVLVEGTVRRIGDRIRVTAQLVSVKNGYQLWSDVYEARLTTDFSAEVAIAEFFSNQVRAQLAAPFAPNVQFVEFRQSSISVFDDVFADPIYSNDSPDSDSEEEQGQ